MSSRKVSACYPRRTFDPLSESLSTKNSRITITDFRLCLTCPSYSQASFYYCALQLISDQSELTFVRLRYHLGGDRPSQTTHHALSRKISCEKTQMKRVVFQGRNCFLPPILHNSFLFSMQGYSKGARGLTVLSFNFRIFTENSISLRPRWRQWGTCYTIHAGRNFISSHARRP